MSKADIKIRYSRIALRLARAKKDLLDLQLECQHHGATRAVVADVRSDSLGQVAWALHCHDCQKRWVEMV